MVLQFTSTDETANSGDYTTGTNQVTIDKTGTYEISLNVSGRPNTTNVPIYPQITDGSTVLSTSYSNRAAGVNHPSHGTALRDTPM